jgi:mRNA-degrading endonuclease toxin of MazEF toxin-antitoxin module
MRDNPAFSEPSVVLLEQIRTIDKRRIERYLGKATPVEMHGIDKALLSSLALEYIQELLSKSHASQLSGL